MKTESIKNISPVDGRYNKATQELQEIFSEYGLLKSRVKVEVKWLIALSQNPDIKEVSEISEEDIKYLKKIYKKFNLKSAKRIKDFESTTNHDVKAVEYFVKEKIAQNNNLSHLKEWVHFTCTSEDINNLSHGLMLKESRNKIFKPQYKELINKLESLGLQYREVPMMSRTHGQPATPTTVGKEFLNTHHRLKKQFKHIKNVELLGKLNGAVGNYNAHLTAYPDLDWPKFSEKFINDLGLSINPYTTQIEPHDYMAELFHAVIRFNNILIDFSRDVWGYIALGHFKQKAIKGEIGSSTMPHKINPIDFENAEGNLGLSNAMLEHLANKLTISRWQRDLSDSTVLRNLGVGFAYSMIAYKSLIKGVNKLEVNEESLKIELNNNWELLAEPIQTVMRKYEIEGAYEKLKELTRGKKVDREKLQTLIADLVIPEEEKSKLMKLTPFTYIGLANKI